MLPPREKANVYRLDRVAPVKPADTPSAFVETHHLAREYVVGPTTVRALDGVSLRIDRGEFVAVVGVSGSGKSTLLHLLGALDSPSAGRVVVDGEDLATLDPMGQALFRRRKVGFVFQSFHLVPSLSALENVTLALTFQGTFGRARQRDLAMAALERVGVAQRAGHRPSELSGGEQQRVALARALVHRPALLLADEPTGNLDHTTAGGVMERLREAQQQLGATVVLVTHDEEFARQFARRLVRLRDGRVTTEERGGVA
jgi:ABC-type lipoprotein export system ATPase subunit